MPADKPLSEAEISPSPEVAVEPPPEAEEARTHEERCDLYQGRWERDEEGQYPLYQPGSCPYVDEAYSCHENGRQDRGYLRWRWKPDGCDLPRCHPHRLLASFSDHFLRIYSSLVAKLPKITNI